jgi:type II secretory pathway pseudopilin PulG
MRILGSRRRSFSVCAGLFTAMLFFASLVAAQTTPAGQSSGENQSPDPTKDPQLMAEFGRLMEKFEHNIKVPPPRTESRLLPLLPESTMAYAAIPNLGDVVHQALVIFRQELEESSVLREWWHQGDMATNGPKAEDALEKLYQLSQYVGDELVVSATLAGREPRVLFVAEVRKPGLKQFLQQLMNEFADKSKPGMRILDPQELSIAKESATPNEPVLLVRPDFVVGATNLAVLRTFSARLDRGSRDFASAPFGQRVAQAYQGGVAVVGAADLQRLLSLIPFDKPQNREAFERSGFADMKYAVWQQNIVAGQAVTQAELSFLGPRHGVTAWLAAPSPLGSLDFVSPEAMLAGTVVLISPARIFEDIKELTGIVNPNALATLPQVEQMLNLNLKEDLFAQLGGEITGELDSFTLKRQVWRAILRVNDPDRMQRTLTTLLAVGHYEVKPSDHEGTTFYTVTIPSPQKTVEIAYAFLDGYIIVASSRETLAEAVRLHRTGGSLGKSQKLLASLPPGHSTSASAFIYEDKAAMAQAMLGQAPAEMGASLAGLIGKGTPTTMCVDAEESAIRETSTSAGFDAGVVLIAAAVAIPNLLRSRQAANEASAVGTIRTVDTAQVTYASTYADKGFAPDLATLGPDPSGGAAPSADHADLIDTALGNPNCTKGAWCEKSGYRFTLTSVCIQQQCSEYVVTGTPLSSDTGTRNFCSTTDGVIRFQVAPPLNAPVRASECHKWAPLQ